MKNAVTLSFRQEMLQGVHNVLTDTIKMALYTSASNVGVLTPSYTAATNEVAPGSGYVAGGQTISGKALVVDGPSVVFTFADVEWAMASFTARFALLYNVTKQNRSISAFDLLFDRTGTGATFRLKVPPPNAAAGIIRFIV